jgi:hypothetical protein
MMGGMTIWMVLGGLLFLAVVVAVVVQAFLQAAGTRQ